MSGRIGVCSWSLEPVCVADLRDKVLTIGVDCVQLDLGPLREGLWDPAETIEHLQYAGITVASGMMRTVGEDYSTLESIRRTGGLRPDPHWEQNLRIARETARLAASLNIPLVTFHAGFIPPDPSDPERRKLLDRLRTVADAFARHGVRLGLETGQESAETLEAALAELNHPAIGVNFDPANMILYDMGEPVAALRRLAPHVVQIHIKDAVRTTQPGTWGTEVPVGQGEVDFAGLLEVCRDCRLNCDLMIERESGSQRIEQMRQAREQIQRLLHCAPP